MVQAKTVSGNGPGISRPGMSQDDFITFSTFIHDQCGIKLPPAKKTMLEARLQKRLRYLNLPDYREYCDYVFGPGGLDAELPHLLDVVTTNTTDFFREPRHFDILKDEVLPRWLARHGGRRPMAFWSAGCSTGEEPYTISMVLHGFLDDNPDFRFSIQATDISTRVLQTAARAIYTEDKIAPVPARYKRYMLRSKDRSKGLVRMGPELRKSIDFSRLNFMEEFPFSDKMDIIFCRNVMIYFERHTQEELLLKFCSRLEPGGFLFIGHSESITGMRLPLKQVAPTVYRRQ